MKVDKRLVVTAVAAFAVAWFVAHGDGGIPNPFVPEKKDRPVLRFIAAAAKKLLWVAVFLEPRPPIEDQRNQHHIVRATIGPDGHDRLDHGDL